MWRRHIAMAVFMTLLGAVPAFGNDAVRWIKTTKKAPKGAYLMPGKGGVHICAKRGDPGTLMLGKGRICTYVNSQNGSPKWTNHYHVLGLVENGRATWRPSGKVKPDESGALAKTPSGQQICRAKVAGAWYVGRIIPEKFSCLFTANEKRIFTSPGKHEVLLVFGSGSHSAASAKTQPEQQSPFPRPLGKSEHVAQASVASASPVRWLKAEKSIPIRAYRMGKESGSDDPTHVCRVRHARWGWFAGTLSGAAGSPRCVVAIGGRSTRYENYQSLALNHGYQVGWQKPVGSESPPQAVVASPPEMAKTFVCRVKVDKGVYVIGDLDGGECTIPYTAHQTNPVPVKDKYEIMVWRGRFTGPAPKSALVGLNPVKWVLSEDDVPPDAFLDQHEHANYVCRVKHGERGWRIGTMNKLRDVRQVDGKTLPLARTCYVKQGDKVVHYRKYEVLVFKNGYSGRWHRLDGSLPKTAVRVTFSDGEEIHVCANLRQGELQSGTFIKGVCTLPSDKNSGHTDGAVRILVADKLELAEGASGGDFGGEYRCLVEAGKSDRAVFLLITAKGRDSAGGPFKVAMQQGAAENQKFDLNLPGQSGIGLHYPNAFSFAKRQMVVAHGAQALGANKKLDTFVALMNLSDTSGDGSQLRMTTLSAELTPIVDDDGSKQSAAKPGTGEGRAWRCQRIRKF